MTEVVTENFVTYLVDDDEAIRSSLESLFEVRGQILRTFESAEAFLASMPCQRPACLLLDEHLPGMSGQKLLSRLQERGLDVPVVLISAFADRSLAVSALRTGALTVLGKPIDAVELFEAIDEAAAMECLRLKDRQEFDLYDAMFASLNPGELEVMKRIVAGEQNKAIAYDLTVSLRTVELRRHNIFRKLGVDGVADLVKRKIRYLELGRRFAPRSTDPLGLHDDVASMVPKAKIA
jgi:FixJ family two-component response regulator